MKFDKETVIGIVCCLLLVIAWPQITTWLGYAPAGENTAVESVEENSSAVQAAAPAAPAAAAVQKSAAAVSPVQKAKEIVLENEDLKLTVSPVRGGIVKTEFVKYDNSARDQHITIAQPEDKNGIFAVNVPGWNTVSVSAEKLTDRSCRIIKTIASVQGSLEIIQNITLPEKGYVIDSTFSIINRGKNAVALGNYDLSGAMISPWHIVSGDKKRTVSHRWDYFTAGKEHDDLNAGKDFLNPPPKVEWGAVSNRYFCGVLKRVDGNFTVRQDRTYIGGDEDNPAISAGAQFEPVQLAPDAAAAASFQLYYGPKEIDALSAFAEKAVSVMHLAWGPLNYLARALFWILSLFYKICGSYGVSIILLTLLVRIVFYPLTARGNESMKKMQKVQPKFKELREKYKDNPQLLNQKMTELYRQEGVNPLAGCLPILLQIPIFFALYAMLDNVVELRHVSFLWCKNLAAADTVVSIPLFGWSLPVNPLVLAMTVLMVIQQRMTPMSMEPAQKKMMAMMPVIMLIFLYDLPSGLTLYWTVSNFFSIIQLWLQKRRGREPEAAAPAK